MDAVLVVNAFKSDFNISSYFASFCYSVYFSVIVLKLGLKLLRIIRLNINYSFLRKFLILGFALYLALLIAALGYSIAKK